MASSRIHDRPTAESIEAARAHQSAERAKVEAPLHVTFTDDGVIRRPKPQKVACGLCNYTASALNQGRAVNAVAGHIVSQHFPQHVKEQR